jgi:hypothetical protein
MTLGRPHPRDPLCSAAADDLEFTHKGMQLTGTGTNLALQYSTPCLTFARCEVALAKCLSRVVLVPNLAANNDYKYSGISVSAVKSVAHGHNFAQWTPVQHSTYRLGVKCLATLVALHCLGSPCEINSRLAAGCSFLLAAAAVALFRTVRKAMWEL